MSRLKPAQRKKKTSGLSPASLADADELSAEIKDVFDQAQDINKATAQARLRGPLLSLFHQCQEESEFRTFLTCFLRLLVPVLENYDPNKHVDNCLKFIVGFALDATPLATADQSQDDLLLDASFSVSHPVAVSLFQFFIQFHKHPDKGFRFRLCCLIRDILRELSEKELEIDSQLADSLTGVFLERTKDKLVKIRLVAIEALAAFQESDDVEEECPVMQTFIDLLSDGSSDVRETALREINVTGKTLKPIRERTRDISESIRILAYERMAKHVSIRSLKSVDRLSLMKHALTDVAPVRKVCETVLLKEWLRSSEGKIHVLLRKLDVDICDDPETIEQVLWAVFRLSKNLEDVVDNFFSLSIFDENSKELTDSSGAEVCYWHHLVKYVNETARDEAEKQKFLDRLLPSLLQLSDYVYRYISEHPPKLDETSGQMNNVLEEEFVSKQLLNILPYADDSDAAGSNRVREVLENLISDKRTNNNLLDLIVQMYVQLHTASNTVDTAIRTVCELISGLRESPSEHLMETEETILETTSCDSVVPSAISPTPAQQDVEGTLKQQLPESVDEVSPEILVKSLSIACSLLNLNAVSRINEVLKTLLDVLILPCVKHRSPVVRNLAFRSLGMCCLVDEGLAKRHVFLFFTTCNLDQEKVRISSLEAIFDILLVYGMQILGEALGEAENAETETRTLKDATDRALEQFLELLDGENVDLQFVVAEGLAKMFLHQRIYAPKVLSRLVLIWFNQVSADNTRMRHCLGVFFPKFAFSDCANQEALEEAFFDVMSTLFNAPDTSPLSKIDCWVVASFLVHLTQSSKLTSKARVHEEGTVHANLSMRLCDDILNDPESEQTKLFCRILPELELDKMSEQWLKDMKGLLRSALRVVQQKLARKCVEKVLSRIKELTQEEDPEEEKQSNTTEIDDESSRMEQLEMTIIPNRVPNKQEDTDARPRKRGLLKKNNTTLKTPATTSRTRLGSENSALGLTPMRRSKRLQLRSEDLTQIREIEINSDDN